MNNKQLNEALKLAQSNVNLSAHDERIFDGCMLRHAKPIIVTIQQIALLLRSNVVMFSGGIDSFELSEIAYVGRHKFTIVGQGS